MNSEDRVIERRLKVLRLAEQTGNVATTYQYFGIGRARRLPMRRAANKASSMPTLFPRTLQNTTPPEIVEKVLHLRSKYQLGAIRIVWCIARRHDIKISSTDASRILKRNSQQTTPWCADPENLQ